MLQHLFASYGVIGEINLEENAVKMMGPYDPTEPLARLIEQLEKGREFAREGGRAISNAMMMSKVITLLVQTGILMIISESGDDNLPTSKRGRNINCFSSERTEIKNER